MDSFKDFSCLFTAASLANISQKLLPDHSFHIYNRAINGGKTFFKEKDYIDFLHKPVPVNI